MNSTVCPAHGVPGCAACSLGASNCNSFNECRSAGYHAVDCPQRCASWYGCAGGHHAKGCPLYLGAAGHMPDDAVNHPAHYGGDTVYEVIKVCEAWGLDHDAYLFNVVKYIGRPGKGDYLEDLKKARFYLDQRIKQMERDRNAES